MLASFLDRAGCFGRPQTLLPSRDDTTAAERARLPRILCIPAGPLGPKDDAPAPLSPASEVDSMDCSRQLAKGRPAPGG